MEKQTLKVFFLLSFIFYFFSLPIFATNGERREGWAWSNTLNFKSPDQQESQIDKYHFEIANLVESWREPQNKPKPPKLKEKSVKQSEDTTINPIAKKPFKQYMDGDKINGRSINGKSLGLIRLGFLVKNKIEEGGGDGINYTYKHTICFENLLFFSGSSLTEQPILQDPYHVVTPNDYSFKPHDILEEITQRFPESDQSSSLLGDETYEKCSFKELSTLLDTMSPPVGEEAAQKWQASLKNNLTKLLDQHAHAEPKILFFLDKTLSVIPAYWNFDIDFLLNNAIVAVEDFVSNNIHQNFSTNSMHLKMKNIREALLKSSDKPNINKIFDEDIRNLLDMQLKQVITNSELERLKQTALDSVNQLSKVLWDFKELQTNNPLHIELSDPQNYRDKAFQALRKLEEFIHRKPYSKEEYLDKDKNELSILRETLIYQTPQKVSEEDWIMDLRDILNELKEKDEEVIQIILSLYSYYDICEYCAPSLARECERKDGFVERLKSIIIANTTTCNVLPSFRILASCGKIREGEEGERRWKAPLFNALQSQDASPIDWTFFGTDPTKESPIFFQTNLDFNDWSGILLEKRIADAKRDGNMKLYEKLKDELACRQASKVLSENDDEIAKDFLSVKIKKEQRYPRAKKLLSKISRKRHEEDEPSPAVVATPKPRTLKKSVEGEGGDDDFDSIFL